MGENWVQVHFVAYHRPSKWLQRRIATFWSLHSAMPMIPSGHEFINLVVPICRDNNNFNNNSSQVLIVFRSLPSSIQFRGKGGREKNLISSPWKIMAFLSQQSTITYSTYSPHMWLRGLKLDSLLAVVLSHNNFEVAGPVSVSLRGELLKSLSNVSGQLNTHRCVRSFSLPQYIVTSSELTDEFMKLLHSVSYSWTVR